VPFPKTQHANLPACPYLSSDAERVIEYKLFKSFGVTRWGNRTKV